MRRTLSIDYDNIMIFGIGDYRFGGNMGSEKGIALIENFPEP